MKNHRQTTSYQHEDPIIEMRNPHQKVICLARQLQKQIDPVGQQNLRTK